MSDFHSLIILKLSQTKHFNLNKPPTTVKRVNEARISGCLLFVWCDTFRKSSVSSLKHNHNPPCSIPGRLHSSLDSSLSPRLIMEISWNNSHRWKSDQSNRLKSGNIVLVFHNYCFMFYSCDSVWYDDAVTCSTSSSSQTVSALASSPMRGVREIITKFWLVYEVKIVPNYQSFCVGKDDLPILWGYFEIFKKTFFELKKHLYRYKSS